MGPVLWPLSAEQVWGEYQKGPSGQNESVSPLPWDLQFLSTQAGQTTNWYLIHTAKDAGYDSVQECLGKTEYEY